MTCYAIQFQVIPEMVLLIKLLSKLHFSFTFPCSMRWLAFHPLVFLLIFDCRPLLLGVVGYVCRTIAACWADHSACIGIGLGNSTLQAHPTREKYFRLVGYKVKFLRRSRIQGKANMYLRSAAASSALGFVTVATRLPPSFVLVSAKDRDCLPSRSLLTRSWIPTKLALDSTTAPIDNKTIVSSIDAIERYIMDIQNTISLIRMILIAQCQSTKCMINFKTFIKTQQPSSVLYFHLPDEEAVYGHPHTVEPINYTPHCK